MSNEIKTSIFDILKFHKIDERVNVKIILDSNKRTYSLINVENGHNLTHYNKPDKINHCLYFCDKNGEFYHIDKETFEVFSKRLSQTEKEGLKITLEGYAYKKLRELNDVCGKNYTTLTYEPRMTDFNTMQAFGYSMSDEGIII